MVNSAKKEQNLRKLLSRLDSALKGLEGYGFSEQESLILIRKKADGIPLSIFNPTLGTLESIVKYMRESLLLEYSTIGRMLGRGEGPVGVTYRRARKKLSAGLDTSSQDRIPFSVLQNAGLSVLESISVHLTARGYGWHDIASILCRDDKTIWTVLDRARRKMAK